jgi:hypothetical protein
VISAAENSSKFQKKQVLEGKISWGRGITLGQWHRPHYSIWQKQLCLSNHSTALYTYPKTYINPYRPTHLLPNLLGKQVEERNVGKPIIQWNLCKLNNTAEVNLIFKGCGRVLWWNILVSYLILPPRVTTYTEYIKHNFNFTNDNLSFLVSNNIICWVWKYMIIAIFWNQC